MSRPESGTMKFGDEWTGVFLRGDDAFGYAVALEALMEASSNAAVMAHVQLGGLLRVLKSSNEFYASDEDKGKVQTLQPFDQCLRK